jgi:hypothetical protein
MRKKLFGTAVQNPIANLKKCLICFRLNEK